ncbi:hypothetical protein HispidOSU_018400 [Sigmodon hispidus]
MRADYRVKDTLPGSGNFSGSLYLRDHHATTLVPVSFPSRAGICTEQSGVPIEWSKRSRDKPGRYNIVEARIWLLLFLLTCSRCPTQNPTSSGRLPDPSVHLLRTAGFLGSAVTQGPAQFLCYCEAK